MLNCRLFALTCSLVVTCLVQSFTHAQAPDRPLESIAAKLTPSRTVTYRTVDRRELKLHIFEPATTDLGAPRPVFLSIHGGGWTGGTPRYFYPFAKHFSDLGMVGISLEYRLKSNQTGTTVLDCVSDAQSAVRYIRQHAKELNIDPHRIVVSGGSAGGHVAAGTALFSVPEDEDSNNSISCVPNALVLYYPVIDTSKDGYGQAKIGSRWKEISPVDQVRPGLPPTILFHGTADTVTPFQGAKRFHQGMREVGNDCELVAYPGGQHGYLIFDLALFNDSMARTESFLRQRDIIDAPIELGNRRELFIDDFLIESMTPGISQQLIQPTPKEVVLVTDAPWEGNTSGYYSVFQEENLYRMIYRGWQHDQQKKAVHQEVTCYAESTDGIHWTKPNIGLHQWNGSNENNIVWLGPGTHNFTATVDTNPNTTTSSRYKALGSGRGGLQAFESADCKNWQLVQSDPVITNGAFDSQNLAFWDAQRNEYRAYWRHFAKGVRAIRTATSQDFVSWHNEADLTYAEGTPEEHLYTNAIQKYYRAPHLFVGFPTRFTPNTQQVEPILMSSRDGVRFQRYAGPVIPQDAPKDRDHNRSNYMVWGMVTLPHSPNEISVYATENYYESTPGRVRRFTYRVDGFVALRAANEVGHVLSRPIRYSGELLQLNYRVQSGGHLKVEFLDLSNNPVGVSKTLTGDEIDGTVAWEASPMNHNGTIRMKFTFKKTDLYSMRLIPREKR